MPRPAQSLFAGTTEKVDINLSVTRSRTIRETIRTRSSFTYLYYREEYKGNENDFESRIRY
jgi:hypothetical protein